MKEKKIAFTFDDAPHYFDLCNNPTKSIIDCFEKYGGKATFFLIGTSIEKYGDTLVKGLIQKGFEIANHTYSHSNLSSMEAEEIEKEITDLQRLVFDKFGVKMKYMRPSGLKFNDKVLEVCDTLKMPMIFGSFGDAYVADWDEKTTPEYVLEHCLNYAYDGQIILMHSYSKSTEKALPLILETLSKNGYKFVTISELFESFGVKEIPCNRPLVDAQLTNIL